ncbi:MAG: hypothetical protein RR729_16235, partial [Comamonas sp.]
IDAATGPSAGTGRGRSTHAQRQGCGGQSPMPYRGLALVQSAQTAIQSEVHRRCAALARCQCDRRQGVQDGGQAGSKFL